MIDCETCRARAHVEASQREEIEHLRDQNNLLRAEVVARENDHETVTAMLIAEATNEEPTMTTETTDPRPELDIPLEPVTGSSMITAFGYHVEEQTLRLQFKGGKEYDYYPVTLEQVKAMKVAESMGQYVNKEIKPKCATRPILHEKAGV